jgi:hypothetical protein
VSGALREFVAQFLDFAVATIATLTAIAGLTGLATDRRVEGFASRHGESVQRRTRGFDGLAANFVRSGAGEYSLGKGSSLSIAASLSSPSGERLTSATLVPPVAVNPREVDAVEGARAGAGGRAGGTYGAT